MQNKTNTQANQYRPTRVIVIEEHRGVRAALSQTLLRRSDMLPVYVAPYLPSRPEQLLEFQPEVILIGLPQNAVSTLETLADQIRFWKKNNIQVIALSTYQDLNEAAMLQAANVYAYILKTAEFGDLATLIKQAAQQRIQEKAHV
ncbi:MAG: hypothetical protein AAGD96_20550 [Chloroflexota bacterium]